MKSLLTKLRYAPKRFAMVAAILVASSTAALTFAWGPDRPTFTMESPAPYVTFNSITNNPAYGDEREFTLIKDLTTGAAIGDEATLVAGHEYQVQIYVHNDASETLNESGVGVAKDTTIKATIPSTVNGDAKLYGHVSASNAAPREVYDSVALKSAGEVSLEYVAGSAKLVTQYQNVALGDTLATTGVKAGDQDLSGNWRGCANQSGVVTFKIKVKEQPTSNFTMTKQVRKHSTTAGGWVENYAAQPGEVVDFVVDYRNTGGVAQQNVIVKDTLPAGMTYVSGSTVLANGSQPNGAAAADTVTTTGLNIGTYAPNASAWVRFSAKVAANDKLEACGPNTLKNVASVTTGGVSKTDDATVTVSKTCVDQKTIEVCRLSDKTKVTINEKDFDATKYSKNFADCKETPVTEDTPQVIASTGPGAIIGGLFGSSALGLGISSFVRSRRALRSALND